VAGYGEHVGLPVEGRAFVAHLKDHLARIAAEADASFPANEYLRARHEISGSGQGSTHPAAVWQHQRI
jgi:hypothetical protein